VRIPGATEKAAFDFGVAGVPVDELGMDALAVASRAGWGRDHNDLAILFSDFLACHAVLRIREDFYSFGIDPVAAMPASDDGDGRIGIKFNSRFIVRWFMIFKGSLGVGLIRWRIAIWIYDRAFGLLDVPAAPVCNQLDDFLPVSFRESHSYPFQ
jgi:hypothetical protein